MTLEARVREIVEKWRNIVGTDAVSERDYYETKDYEMLIEWFVAALTEQDEELALEAAHFKELYSQHQILRTQRDALETLLAHTLLRWSLRDWEGADVFAGDHVPMFKTWEEIQARAALAAGTGKKE